MAAPMKERESTDISSNLRCIVHYEGLGKEREQLFTKSRWDKFRECAHEWLKLDGLGKWIAEQATSSDINNKEFIDAPKDTGFHPTCYRRFTDKFRIVSARNRIEKEKLEFPATSQPGSSESVELVEDLGPSSPKKLRSKTRIHTGTVISAAPEAKRKSKSVLPVVCIICKKRDRFITVGGNRKKDVLTQAQTQTAGQLLKAAELKEDEDILRHIRGQDCVAIEVRYHQKCYRQYTEFLRRLSESKGDKPSVKYLTTYNIFCEDVIRERIINGQEIIRMVKLYDIFVRLARQHENVDASSYSSLQLKKRLQVHFPQLLFHRPSKCVKNEMVFVQENFKSSTSEYIETEMESANTGGQKTLTFDDDTLHCLHTSAMELRVESLKTGACKGPWHPLASDINTKSAKSLIPLKLYNTLAWMIGASDDPTLEYYVEVEESVDLKLISILQGIILLQYQGRNRSLT